MDEQLNRAMLMLAKEPEVIFIGQNVSFDGNVLYKHLKGIPNSKRLELPVAEELQMGMSIGLALDGYLPISIYPRMDFLLLAMNQLVNHLDKLPAMTTNGYRPKVIIRTKVGDRAPLNAGPQHTQNHTGALQQMLTTVMIEYVQDQSQIMKAYASALARCMSTIVVEDLGTYPLAVHKHTVLQ